MLLKKLIYLFLAKQNSHETFINWRELGIVEGMTGRRSFDCDRYREVIADLCLKKRSQGDRDRDI